ncbi:MAG: glycosyl hydrolase family 18 protein [Desulfocucumaceae bacterium]
MRRKLILNVFLLVLTVFFCSSSTAFAVSGNAGVLKVGSTGGRVSELQQVLQKEGFFPSAQKVTGYFGWITYGAVTAMEKKYGLAVNGQVGQQEWNILYGKKSGVVLGYYATDYPGDKLSYNSLREHYRQVNLSAMFDFTLDEKGNLKGSASAAGIREAKSKGIKTLMVVHNITGLIDSRSAYMAITSSRKRLVDNIVSQIEKNGYDGVNIDLEGIPPQYKNDYNALLSDLSGYLKPRGKLLTVAIPAKTSNNGSSWNGAYDYQAIGRMADYIVIMSYDEHWSSGPPGPVASIPWVDSVLKYATSVIPPEKILMGIGCYGYDWPSGKAGKALRWKDIPSFTSQYGGAQWDNISSAPKLVYWENGVKHQLWFENRYSLAIKLGLVKNYKIGGIAFWRMGFEDASFWDTLGWNL